MATRVYHDLTQFSSYAPPANLSFHQYLLSGQEPLLVHTGNVSQSRSLVSELKAALQGRPLAYIFISHFEADECGGLSVILESFPAVKAVCSEVTARQLAGFGITDQVIVKKSGENLTTEGYELRFIGYPSEAHLWAGLLAYESRRGIFFSSDLMFQPGESAGQVIESDWAQEVKRITPQQIPDAEQRARLQETLAGLKVRFIATGHGPCRRCG
jgi:flavorubredoxin